VDTRSGGARRLKVEVIEAYGGQHADRGLPAVAVVASSVQVPASGEASALVAHRQRL
jgi:hypothetical protein